MLKQNETKIILSYFHTGEAKDPDSSPRLPFSFWFPKLREPNMQLYLLWQGLAQDTENMKDHNKVL